MRAASLVSRFATGFLLPWVAGCGDNDLLLSGSPAGLEAVSGDGQEAQVGSPLADPLVVRATDEAGRPVQGVRVAFQFDGDVGGNVAPDTAETDADGRASADIRLGTLTGAQLVDATIVEGPADAVVTFRLTALAPPDDGGGGDGDGGGGDGGGGDGDGGGDGGGGGGGRGGGDDDNDDDDHGHDD